MFPFAMQVSVTAAQPAVQLSRSVQRVSAATGISDLFAGALLCDYKQQF